MIKRLFGYSLFDYIGKIGVYGDLTFTIGGSLMLSPVLGTTINKGHENIKHEVIGSADLTEFKKRKLRTLTLQIKAVEGFNSIGEIIEKLTRISENGEHYPLIIGNDALSENDFIVSNLDEGIQKTDSKGNSTFSTISISFEEYISAISRGEKKSENIEQNETEKTTNLEINEKNEKIYKELEVLSWLQ
ncbi:MAG: phage tail protein [Cetobacterium sp.]